MNRKTILEVAILISLIRKAIAQKLLEKYSTTLLSEIEIFWPYATATQISEDRCPNILTAIIRGSSQGITEAEAI